jgi:hypothetical protein
MVHLAWTYVFFFGWKVIVCAHHLLVSLFSSTVRLWFFVTLIPNFGMSSDIFCAKEKIFCGRVSAVWDRGADSSNCLSVCLCTNAHRNKPGSVTKCLVIPSSHHSLSCLEQTTGHCPKCLHLSFSFCFRRRDRNIHKQNYCFQIWRMKFA